MTTQKLDHLADHHLTYWQHWLHSWGLAVRLGKLSLKSVWHCFFPNHYADLGPKEIWTIKEEIKDLPNVKEIFAKLDQEAAAKKS
jgi:hypothetical protein